MDKIPISAYRLHTLDSQLGAGNETGKNPHC